MSDDIVRHLFLDESLVAHVQRKQLTDRQFSEPSKWMLPVAKFVGDMASPSRLEPAKRLVLLAAGATFVGIVAWFAWYWVSAGRFIESTDDAYVGGDVT